MGFEVAREDPHGDGNTWIALTRKDAGSEEMFAEIVLDVVGTMDAVSESDEEVILRTMLSRVRAWQEFMRKTPRGLSPEAEIGLAGELTFLGHVARCGGTGSIRGRGMGRPGRWSAGLRDWDRRHRGQIDSFKQRISGQNRLSRTAR